MPLIRLCSRVSNMASVSERGTAGSSRLYTQTLENVIAALAAGLQPDFIQPQNVLVGMGVVALADFVQCIHHGLKLLGQLVEHLAQDFSLAARQRVAQRGVGSTAHVNVIVDINELAREALRE